MPKQFNNSSGLVFLTILLTVAVLFGAAFIYYYYTQLRSLGPLPIPFVNQTPAPVSETASWKPYESSLGISMKIPNEWYVSDDKQYVSQYPFTPKLGGTTDTYNAFHISKTKLQLQSGYTNEDWLNRIFNLKPDERLSNEFRPATTLQIAKINSGRTANGERFVVFKNTSLAEGAFAAFMDKDDVYQFNLQYYDQNGLDTFQKIMTTVTVNSSEQTP